MASLHTRSVPAGEDGMGGETFPKPAEPPLVDKILQTGKAAFDPSLPEEARLSSQMAFQELIQRLVMWEAVAGRVTHSS